MGITGKDADYEVRKLDDLAKGVEGDSLQVTLLRAIVKGVAVIGKLLVGVRGNQVTALVKQYGRDVLRQPKRPDTDKDNTTQDGKE